MNVLRETCKHHHLSICSAVWPDHPCYSTTALYQLSLGLVQKVSNESCLHIGHRLQHTMQDADQDVNKGEFTGRPCGS